MRSGFHLLNSRIHGLGMAVQKSTGIRIDDSWNMSLYRVRDFP